MQVHHDIDQLPVFRNAVLTIGTFDGVHLGHRQIIDALKQEAAAVGGESIIITFHPHPRKIVNASEPLQLINTPDEKIELLSAAGIDHLVIVPFTNEFANLTASEYIGDFLVRQFHPHTIIIGYDHHFGKGRSGNIELLQQSAASYNYRVQEIPKHLVDELGVSSTKIRKALLESDIDTANKLLGYRYYFNGVVIRGDQLGRQLGYPTANLEYTNIDKIHLGHGVYAVYVHIHHEKKLGMMSIGIRPTLKNSDERVEVNIFDFDEDIYDQHLGVEVVSYLRPQEKYNSLDELIAQLHLDKENSLKILE